MNREASRQAGPNHSEEADVCQRVRVVVPGDLALDSAGRQSAAVDALAAIIGISSEAIRVRAAPEGKTAFKLSLPFAAVERIRSLLQSNSAQLRLLRVERVVLEGETGAAEEWAIKEGRFEARAAPQEVEPAAARPKPQPVNLFRPILVGAMIGCIAWSLVGFARILFPAWNGAYLVVGCVLAAVEAGYSFQLIRPRRLFTDEVVRFRAIELALLLILLKAGSYVAAGWQTVVADIRRWPHDPLLILDLQTAVLFVLAFSSWLTATVAARDLDRVGESPERSRYYVSPMQSLSGRFFWGGGLLLVVSGLILIGRTAPASRDWSLGAILRSLRGSPSPELAFNVLLYFLLGLVALGQVRSTILIKRWREQEIPVDEVLPRRWVRASLVLVGLAALLAFLLPTGYTVGLLELVGTAVLWAAAILTYVFGLLMLVGALICSPLFALLAGLEVPPAKPVRPRLEPPPPAPTAAGYTPDWVLLMRSVLFWALIVAGALYVVRAYLHDHPELSHILSQLRPVRTLRRLWAAMLSLLGRWRRSVRLRLPRRTAKRREPREERGRPFRFFRLGALSPRERIRYYYLSILRRAERLGYPRRPPQTPHEYHDAMEPHLQQAHQEMDSLTEAFVEVRYSQHSIGSDQAREVREAWRRVKLALRSLRRAGEEQGRE